MLEADIHKQLRDFSLDLSLRVNPGDVLALMGENGAGKSTVLNILSGLISPDAGSIRLNGKFLYNPAAEIRVPVEDRGIGYVLQSSAVFPHLSVRENIAYGLKAKHQPSTRIEGAVDRWMGLLDIRNLSSVKAGNLSGGQKQRVALARVFATRPRLLMLDEPFTALDAGSAVSVKNIIRNFVTEMEIPCIIVTHRIADSHEIANHACVICRGQQQWAGSPCMPDGLFSGS